MNSALLNWTIFCLDSKDDYHGPGLTFSRIKNYPGPQVALNWWETACRHTNGESSKSDKNNGNFKKKLEANHT